MSFLPREEIVLGVSEWNYLHGANVVLHNSGLLEYWDVAGGGYHIIGAEDPRFMNRWLHLSVLVWPAADCNAEIYVGHRGGLDVCRFAPDGTVVSSGITETAEATRQTDGSLQVDVVFFSSHGSILFGTSRGDGGQYLADGKLQFLIERAEVTLLDVDSDPAAIPPIVGYMRSQIGQDRFIYENLMSNRDGVFFEVGGHEGVVHSNTFFFENALGWRGVVVEMQPKYFPEIAEKRPGAKCFNCALGVEEMDLLYLDAGDRSGLLRYFEPKAIEYLERHARGMVHKPDYRLGWVKVRPTMDVLAEAGVSHIDYFSLDVEGAEMTILRTIDFSKVTIDVFSIEDNTHTWADHRAYLEPLGYMCLGRFGFDAFFAHERFIRHLAQTRGFGHIATVCAKLAPVADVNVWPDLDRRA